MVIAKGAPWGRPGALPPDAPVARSDAELAALVAPAVLAGRPAGPFGLVGGDLARTCGSTNDEGRLHGPDAHQLPIDVAEVALDGTRRVFVAHLVARPAGRSGWWRGRLVAVMNAEFHGPWDVAPRSHPNDGLVDLLTTEMPVGERLKARSRLATGGHVPHPAIAQRRVGSVELDLGGLHVWLDGVAQGPVQRASVVVHPDAALVVV